MPATLLNAPARPPLTRTLLLALSVALLAAVALILLFYAPESRPDPAAADRPAFIRRTAAGR